MRGGAHEREGKKKSRPLCARGLPSFLPSGRSAGRASTLQSSANGTMLLQPSVSLSLLLRKSAGDLGRDLDDRHPYSPSAMEMRWMDGRTDGRMDG